MSFAAEIQTHEQASAGAGATSGSRSATTTGTAYRTGLSTRMNELSAGRIWCLPSR